jgi:hypothetical protein
MCGQLVLCACYVTPAAHAYIGFSPRNHQHKYLLLTQIALCGSALSLCAGERHGTPAERLLAAQRRANQAAQSRPHTLFATGPQQQPQHIPESQQNFGMQQPAAAPQAPLPAVPAAAAALPPVPQMPQMPPPPMAAVPPPWHMQPPVAPHGYYPGPVSVLGLRVHTYTCIAAHGQPPGSSALDVCFRRP